MQQLRFLHTLEQFPAKFWKVEEMNGKDF